MGASQPHRWPTVGDALQLVLAAGDLTGRDDLRREGEVDEDTGKARQELNEAAEKAGGALEEVSGKVKDALPSDEGSDSSAGSTGS